MGDFVSFELAQRLQEKGFTLEKTEIYGKFDSDGLFHSQLYFNYIETMDCDEIIAPTISQILKWLRKEKKIHICVDFDVDMNWYYQIAIFGSTDIAADGYGYNDYEMSALAGIERVLDNFI